ncbi:hypothetical protein V1527DRAFT_467097 [Lipomyces starkeyi]
MSISLEMASYDNERASYQRALNFLTANGRLDIYLAYKSFQSLEKKAGALYGDAK